MTMTPRPRPLMSPASMTDRHGGGDWPNLDAILAAEVADQPKCPRDPEARVVAVPGHRSTRFRCSECYAAVPPIEPVLRADRRTLDRAVNAAVCLEQEVAMLAAAVRDAAEALEDAEEHAPFSSTVHERNVDRARGILNGALARIDGAP